MKKSLLTGLCVLVLVLAACAMHLAGCKTAGRTALEKRRSAKLTEKKHSGWRDEQALARPDGSRDEVFRAPSWEDLGRLRTDLRARSFKGNAPAARFLKGPAGTGGIPKYEDSSGYNVLSGDYRDVWRRGGVQGGGDLPAEIANRLVSAGEEIWVIQRYKLKPGEVVKGERPGSGALMATLPKEKKEVPVPLKHTDVKASVLGYIATVEVTQQFHNPFNVKIEAKYVFPLPQNAAINEFIMTVGDRRIRGIIRKREEAKRIYEAAKRRGLVASLLTQERPNIFTQSVANIEPSKAIDVNIKYFNTLAYRDGWYEFVFPMVVGPRFNPPGFTDGVGAVARGRRGLSGQKTEVQYLRPDERSGHDINVTVKLDAGVKIEELDCPSHAVDKQFSDGGVATVTLKPLDRIPNKDLVLRYKVAGRRIKSSLFVQRDKRGGFFTLMLFPPEDLRSIERHPVEMIFVLDCSGSMRGWPLAKAKAAMERALKSLRPDDTFQVIRFSNNASKLGPEPIRATAKNVRRGLRYVKSLRGSGGTMMIEGIKAALDFAHDPERLRIVSFMTDGYIGNEAQILREISKRLGASRIFSFGVGSSVNRYLLNRMALIGRGAVAYVGLDESAGRAVDLFYERIRHPAMTEITVDWGDLGVSDVYPIRMPDLFVGRPAILTGRFRGAAAGKIRIRGKVGGKPREIALTVRLPDSPSHGGVAAVWARKQIAVFNDLLAITGDKGLPNRIKNVALEFGLMSRYTAFVAVDSLTRTSGDHGVSVVQPVPMPKGVRYDTTVAP